MIIITDANGNLQAPTIPENIYQGSNKANSIVFLSPLAQSNTATIMFRLPNGLLTPEYLMTPYDDVPSQYKLNAWVRDIESDITALYGVVTYQIKLTNANGTVVTSVAGTFNVLRGVAPLPSTTPSTTNWAEILSYLSQINSDIENGWLVSKGILPYDVNYAYPLNASVWNKANNTIYTSLVDDNLGNALTDTSKWGATSLVAMSDLNDYYTKGETDNLLNNKANINDVPTKTSDLTNDSGFITKEIDDLVNYYKKSETYTQAEVDGLIANINAIQIRNIDNEAINATSATVQSVATQYIVDNYQRQPKQLDGLIITLTDQNNDKVLFVYSETSSLWINVGLNGVDLSNYFTKEETRQEIAKSDITSITSIDTVVGTPVVNYDTTNGINIESTAKVIYGEVNEEKQISLSQEIPLIASDGLSMDADVSNEKVKIKLETATTNTLGGIKVGNNLTITEDGTLSAQAGVDSIGGATGDITLGTGLSIENNVLSASGGGGGQSITLTGVTREALWNAIYQYKPKYFDFSIDNSKSITQTVTSVNLDLTDPTAPVYTTSSSNVNCLEYDERRFVNIGLRGTYNMGYISLNNSKDIIVCDGWSEYHLQPKITYSNTTNTMKYRPQVDYLLSNSYRYTATLYY